MDCAQGDGGMEVALQTIVKPTSRRIWGATFVGLIVVAFVAWFRADFDLWMQGSRIGFGQLPIAPVVLLALLCWFVQPLLRRFGFSLSRLEAALLFCMLFSSTRFWSSSYSVLPLSLGVGAFYYASPINNYELLHRYIPKWLVPQDKLAIKAFYEGAPDGKVPWGEWLPILAFWTLSTFLLLICLFGLTWLFRKRWTDEEKLVFPIAQVPLAFLNEQEPIWRQKPFWLGFSLPMLIHGWNGLSIYFPVIPAISLHAIPIGFMFTDPPWSILSDMTVDFYPSVIGTAYLTSTDVALGFWLFHLLRNLERVVLFSFGLPPGGVDYGGIDAITRGQEVGAFFALFGTLAWGIWQKRQMASLSASEKFGFIGFVLGLVGLSLFWSFMGADVWAAFAYFLVFSVILLVLTRISCQGGCMFVAMDFHPHNISGYLFGQMSVGLKNLVVLMFPHMAYMMERDVVPLPYMMNATKVASEVGLGDRQFLIGTFLANIVAAIVAPVASLRMLYRHGGLRLHYHYATRLARWAWDKYIGWFSSPAPPDIKATLGIFGGATFTLLLTTLYHRVPNFPFHPLGFTLADSLVVRKVWFSIFLGWLAKGLILRYGGHRVYWAWRPVFIGLVVGELMAAAFWLAVDAFFQKQGHDVFPGFPPL